MLNEVRIRGPVDRPRPPDAVAGDKAYSFRDNRDHLRKRHVKAVSPDTGLYEEKNTVERLITNSRPGEASPPDTTRSRTATSRASTRAPP